MKKITKILFSLIIALVVSLSLVACEKEITIENLTLSESEENKLAVLWGTDFNASAFDDAYVSVNMSDGTTTTVKVSDCAISSFNTRPEFADGENEVITPVTISYAGVSLNANVVVYRKAVRIRIESGTIPVEANHLEAPLNTSGAHLLVTYNDGFVETITDQSKFSISEPVNTPTGEQFLTVTYTDKWAGELKDTTFKYNVNRVLYSVELVGSYPESVLYGTNESEIYKSLSLMAHYSDGDKAVELSEAEIANHINTTPVLGSGEYVSEQTFTLSYGGKSVSSETIKVHSKLEEIEYVSGLANSAVYSSSVDKTNLVVLARFTHIGAEDKTAWVNVNPADLVVEPSAFNELSQSADDKKDVIISYSFNNGIANVTASVTVENAVLVYDELSSISVSALNSAFHALPALKLKLHDTALSDT